MGILIVWVRGTFSVLKNKKIIRRTKYNENISIHRMKGDENFFLDVSLSSFNGDDIFREIVGATRAELWLFVSASVEMVSTKYR